MATTSDLAPNRPAAAASSAATPRRRNTVARAAANKAKEQDLENQISQLQDDIKGIAATLARLSSEKVSEVKDAAKSEALHLQRQGQNVIEEVQDQAGELEQQLKDKIREKPLTAVASAIGIGFVLALLSRR